MVNHAHIAQDRLRFIRLIHFGVLPLNASSEQLLNKAVFIQPFIAISEKADDNLLLGVIVGEFGRLVYMDNEMLTIHFPSTIGHTVLMF